MKIKNIIGFAWAATLLFGGVSASIFYTQKSEMIQEAEAWSLDVTPNVDADYYSSCDGLTGSALTTALAKINQPKNKSYDWSRYEAADEAFDDSSSILCLYTRHNIKKSNHCGSYAWDNWNREHVYPQGTFTLSTTDNHNIYACEGQINNERGNKKFAKVGGTPYVDLGHTTECYSNKNYFEPCDAAKGEVARACMYCTIYYGYTLPQIFDSLQTALDWHAQFPVTAREIYRNNTVYGLQGNRNPFVDHPSYANAIWGANYTAADPLDSEPADPVPVTGVSVNPTSLTLEAGETGTIAATIAPSNATNKKVTWTSSNTAVATVNDGLVTAVAEGTATITVKTNDGDFEATCDVTVTAKIIATTYQVTFNSDGGSVVASQTVESGSTVSEPADPTKQGYTFAGWYLNDQPYNFSTPVTGNITLVAHWTEDGQGGGEGGGDTPIPNPKLISLEITQPNKLEYKVGEELDLTGFKAVAKYKDNSTKDVTDKVELDTVNMNKPGSKIIIVTYQENGVKVTGRIDIKVVEASAMGCHGSIIATSAVISITSLIGLSLLLIKKNKQK